MICVLEAALQAWYSFSRHLVEGGGQHVQVGLRTLYDPSEPAFDFVLPEAPHPPLAEDAHVVHGTR